MARKNKKSKQSQSNLSEQASTSKVEAQTFTEKASTIEFIEKKLTLDENYSTNIKNMLEELIKDRKIDPLRVINFEGITSNSFTEQERKENIKIIKKLDELLQLSKFDENEPKILKLKLINTNNNENLKLIIDLKDLYLVGFINKNNNYFSFKDNRIDEWKEEQEKDKQYLNLWEELLNNENKIKRLIWNPKNYEIKTQEIKEKVVKIENEKLQLLVNENSICQDENAKKQMQEIIEKIKLKIKELEQISEDNLDDEKILDVLKFNPSNKKIQNLKQNIAKKQKMIDEKKKLDQAISNEIDLNQKDVEKIDLDYTGAYTEQGLNVVIKKEGFPDEGRSISICQAKLNDAIKHLSEINNDNQKNQEIKDDLVRIIFVTSEAMRFGSHIKYFNYEKKRQKVEFKNIPENIQKVLDGDLEIEWSKYINQLRGGWTESSKEINKKRKEIFKKLDLEIKYWETINNIFSDKNNSNILNPNINLQEIKNQDFLEKYCYKDLNLINEEEKKEFFKFYNCENFLNSLMNLMEIECNKIKIDKQNIDKFKNKFKLRIMNDLLHSSLHLKLSKGKEAIINFKNESAVSDFKDIIVFALILEENIDLIKLLSYKGININSTTKCGNSSLIEATRCNNLDIVKLLLENGVNVNQQNENGYTALHFAVSANNLEIVQELLNNENSKNKIEVNIKDNYNRTALHCLASNNVDIKILKSLLNHPKINVNIEDNDGNTALHNAIVINNLEIVQELLNNENSKNKIEVNIKNNNGHIALHNATAYNNLNIVKLLLKNGADPNIQDYSGNTPLYQASGLFFLVREELKNSLDYNEKQIPLFEEKNDDYLNIIQELIDNGADPNSKNLYGETPLFIGVRSCDINIVKLLLKNGADPNSKNDQNKKVIHITNNDVIKKILNNFSIFNKKIEILNSLFKEKDLDKEKISKYKNQLENEQKKLKELLNICDIEQIIDNDLIKKTDIDSNFFNQIFIIKVNKYAFDNIGIQYVLNAKNKLEPKYNIKKIGEILVNDLKTENNTEFFCESQTCLIEENLTKEKKEKLQVWKRKVLEKIHKKYQHFMKNYHKISETKLQTQLIALKQKEFEEKLKLTKDNEQEKKYSLKIEEVTEEQAKKMGAIPKRSKIVSSQSTNESEELEKKLSSLKIEEVTKEEQTSQPSTSGCKPYQETQKKKDDEPDQDGASGFQSSQNFSTQNKTSTVYTSQSNKDGVKSSSGKFHPKKQSNKVVSEQDLLEQKYQETLKKLEELEIAKQNQWQKLKAIQSQSWTQVKEDVNEKQTIKVQQLEKNKNFSNWSELDSLLPNIPTHKLETTTSKQKEKLLKSQLTMKC